MEPRVLKQNKNTTENRKTSIRHSNGLNLKSPHTRELCATNSTVLVPTRVISAGNQGKYVRKRSEFAIHLLTLLPLPNKKLLISRESPTKTVKNNKLDLDLTNQQCCSIDCAIPPTHCISFFVITLDNALMDLHARAFLERSTQPLLRSVASSSFWWLIVKAWKLIVGPHHQLWRPLYA